VDLPAPPGGSLFARNEQKDCNGKPDPQGNAQKLIEMVENSLEVNKTRWLSDKDNMLLKHFSDIQFFYTSEAKFHELHLKSR